MQTAPCQGEESERDPTLPGEPTEAGLLAPRTGRGRLARGGDVEKAVALAWGVRDCVPGWQRHAR